MTYNRYGDVSPDTAAGKYLNSLFIIVNIFTFSTFFSIFFNYVYRRQESALQGIKINRDVTEAAWFKEIVAFVEETVPLNEQQAFTEKAAEHKKKTSFNEATSDSGGAGGGGGGGGSAQGSKRNSVAGRESKISMALEYNTDISSMRKQEIDYKIKMGGLLSKTVCLVLLFACVCLCFACFCA